MVQNVSVQNQNNYGSINRIGTTETGRVVYQVSDGAGRVAGRLSVAAKDSDTFEKSYQTMMEAAPKLQKFAENTTPEKMQKKQKKVAWGVGILGAVGAGLGIWFTRNSGILKQSLVALGGAVVGLGTGVFMANKAMTPPGAKELNDASKTLSKLDIQPV